MTAIASRKKLSILTAIIILIAVSTGLFLTKAHKAKINKIPVVNVNTTPVKQHKLLQTITTTGSLLAIKSSTISAKADGTIHAIHFEEGQHIKKGQALIEFDNDEQLGNLAKDKATFAILTKNYLRNKTLNEQHLVSNEDLNTLKTQLEQSRAAVISSQAALDDKQLIAPFDGVAGRFTLQPGDFIKSATPLLTLSNTTQLLVEYHLSQQYINRIKLNQEINVTLDNNNGDKITSKARISFIDDSIDADSQTFTVHAVLNNSKHQFHPGNFVSIQQTLGIKQHVLFVPLKSVKRDINGSSVFTVVNQHAKLIPIKTGAIKGNDIVVTGGLSANQVVITDGATQLKPGDSVRIIHS